MILAETAPGVAALRGPVLEFRAVTKSFYSVSGRVEVLRRVDFTMARGDFVAITGPSGSGKSTLLNLAALLDTPTSGLVRLEDEEVSQLNADQLCERRKHKIGMVFQRFHLLPHRTVLDNVLFRFRYLETPEEQARAAARAALEAVGLAAIAHRTARLLSGGEMQRVAIARALVQPPSLLVADEPTGNLDRHGAQVVMECFQAMNRRGISILLVTHNEALLSYCSRHLICRDGVLESAP